MTATPNLSLPLLAPSQAQKHVTVNEALSRLDALVQTGALDRDLAAPPGAPSEGDLYIVPASATGAWAGWDHSLAVWSGGVWLRIVPAEGWLAWVADEDVFVRFDGSAWVEWFQNLSMLGINTAADATNRLAVAAAATLLSHGGSGGHQLKINKALAADTASLLFQTGWSGRAEMGTAGDDDWSIKVSDDGASWTEALRIARATGRASGAAVQANRGDAAPGKLLTVGAFGIGEVGGAIDMADLNSTSSPAGLYRYRNGSTANLESLPPEAALWGHVLICRYDANRVMQIITEVTQTEQTWLRLSDGDGNWLPWRQIYHSGSILGTVSQSGGTPTGAVIEHGSNANGDYVRWADGTQICSFRTSVASRTAGSATFIDWTYPAGFVSGQLPFQWSVVRSFNNDGSVEDAARHLRTAPRGVSNNSGRFVIVNTHTSDLSGGLALYAIGRWF